MATANVSAFLRRLTRGMVAETLSNLSDRQLVEQFLARHEEAVFEAIVRRHGAMVYRVCWRVLQHHQDAEDAFQATFLLLAQRLRTVRKHASLASWLHGIAHRVALKAKAEAATRRRHEQQASVSQAMPPDDVSWGEVRAVLDAELAGLPEKWRLPLVLCYLEGRTQDEAAEQLGWSKRTLRRRLEEGRTGLGRRLRRRGVVWPAGLSAVLLSDCVASAALSPGLLDSAIKAASFVAAGKAAATGLISAKVAALTEGVLKTMLLTKLKIASVVVLMIAALVGGAGLIYQTQAAESKADKDKQPAAKPAEKPKTDKPKADPDTIAWGKAVHGLQAGIRFRPGDKHSCRIGELAVLEVHLRNIGDKTIQVSYLENVFEESLPTVRDGDGKEYAIRPGPLHLGDVPIVNRTLEAGGSVRLGFALFRIQPPGWKGEVGAPTFVAGPGKYLIGFEGFPLKREKSDRFESWSTGNVELEITARDDLPKGKPVDVPLDLPDGKPVTVPLDLPDGKPVAKNGVIGDQVDENPEPPAWANKLFEKRTQELPKIIFGEKVTYRFAMRNIYEVPLEVTQVRVLNAKGATYSVSRPTLQPKDAGNVEVTVDSNRLAAGKDVKIYVTVGPEYTSTATLTITVKKPK